MKIIPKRVIQDWYKEEYATKNRSSIYGKPVKILLSFFTILDNSRVKTILELGCGDGRNLFELAKRDYQVTGIDLEGEAQTENLAKNHKLKIHFIKEDITKFNFERKKYDAVISSEVFHLLSRKEVEDITKRMKIATKENGFVYISILSHLKRRFLQTKEDFKYEDQADYTTEEAKKLLRTKFKDWKIIELNTFHDEQDWPIKSGKYPIKPYHWSGEYVYLMAQKS